MDIVLDSSSIINMINGDYLDVVCAMPVHTLYIGKLIKETEILETVQKTILDGLIQKSVIQVIDTDMALSQIVTLRNRFGLGLGETECIAICINKRGFYICSDDYKARKSAIKELGEEKVIGSLYLLRSLVLAGKISCLGALYAYKEMKMKGGFLPKALDEDYFCK